MGATSVAYGTINGVPRLGTGLPLVARADELSQLKDALSRAQAGTASAVLISGDAGVGKSRLLGEFAEHATESGATFLIGRCLGVADAGLPYLPFTEVVDRLRSSHPDVVSSRPALSSLGGVAAESAGAGNERSDHELGQLQLFDAVWTALTELSTDTPMVLALEDLHWADPSTRNLLSFLFGRLGPQRLLIVATYRSDDMHRQHPFRPLLAELLRLSAVERLDLAPFTAPDAQAFARALGEDVLSDDTIGEVAERAEGNAFFIEELVSAAATGQDGMPWTLAEVLLARVERLSPLAEKVIRAISVTGSYSVRHETVSSVLGVDGDELEPALREAVQHHILMPSPHFAYAYTFRHALLREAVYADLLPGERVRLHTAYARLVAVKNDPKHAEGLAYHSLHSNDLPTALSASVQAAKNARHVGAPADELRHLEQALELWDAVDDPAERAGMSQLVLTRKAGHAASAAGQPERAHAFCKAALALADQANDPVLAADVRRELAQAQLSDFRWTDFVETVAEAWELIKDQPASKERAWVLALMARRAQKVTDLGDAHTLAQAALADARAAGSSAEADALITLAFLENADGRVEEACALLEQARERAADVEAHGVELRAMFNLSVTRQEQGQLDVAAKVADQGAARAAELGLTWSPYGLELRWIQVLVHYARGAWDQAADAASPPGEQVSDIISGLIAAAGGLVQVGRGRFAEAERMLTRVRSHWKRDGQISQLAGVAGAEMASWQGRPDLAVDLLDEALDAGRKAALSEWPLGGIRMATLGLSAQADIASAARLRNDTQAEAEAVARGQRYADYAEQTVRYGKPRSAEMGPEGQAWIARMQAERGRLTGANDPAAWQAVIDAFGYGEIYPQALGQWRLAEALTSAGDRDTAAAELSQALATAEKLGAVPLATACRQLAERARLGVSRSGGAAPVASDASATLTPRETAVLRLVAEGHTNRQIGEELYISEKTVSVHVSRVMAKLGAAGRTEAVAIAYQRGLLAAPS
jgi:DNA-binding CsgD family transcriptional regulator